MTQLDRIEALLGRRVFSWNEQVQTRFSPGYSGSARSEVIVNPDGVDLVIKDAEALALRDHLIMVYGYPEKRLIGVGDDGL